MKTTILLRRAVWSGVCLGLISWAGVAEAGSVDVGVVSVSATGTSMSGTIYGTSLSADAYVRCEVLGDAWFVPDGIVYCRGEDLQGDNLYCTTEEPALILAVQTMPDYGRISVNATGLSGTCTSMFSYRGSRYLPPGVAGGGHPEMAVGNNDASGTFYGARVSADAIQYATCSVYDSPGYSYVSCQARDAANDYFYCSSDVPGVVGAARALKAYSGVYLYRDYPYSTECIELRESNGSDYVP